MRYARPHVTRCLPENEQVTRTAGGVKPAKTAARLVLGLSVFVGWVYSFTYISLSYGFLSAVALSALRNVDFAPPSLCTRLTGIRASSACCRACPAAAPRP